MSFVEGGSTITQQLLKNVYFTQEKKMTRKVAEVFMAIEIEKKYDKDEILELYLNTCYFGDGYYTIKEASRGYFDKKPKEMSEYEAIMLAGIPNAPPAYGIYICGKVFKWLKKQGGLEAMKEHNEKKAKILYDFLDQSKLFKGTVVAKDRSLMNVPFVTGSDELDAKFIKEAKAKGFESLKGHRSVGGMRASIYNAMPVEGVEKLVEFMKVFEEENLNV